MKKVYKNGLTIGKFMPFHKGHKLMIDFGASMCETMHVLISGSNEDEIRMDTRLGWLLDTYVSHPNVVIHRYQAFDEILDSPLDEHGTAIDGRFWDEWVDAINKFFPDLDAIFTNDAYGEKLSSLLWNVDWVPSDPDRMIHQISGTAIRIFTDTHYHFLTDAAKPYYQKKIAIVGPESTGKSILTERLANEFHGKAVSEYGRTISELRNNKLSANDFRAISIGQKRLVDIAARDNMVVFSDTDAYTTYLYADHYLPDTNDRTELKRELYRNAAKDDYDLYIILAPTVNWVDDGTRTMPHEGKRLDFHARMINHLHETGRNYVVVDDDSWANRTYRAIDQAWKLIDQQKR